MLAKMQEKKERKNKKLKEREVGIIYIYIACIERKQHHLGFFYSRCVVHDGSRKNGKKIHISYQLK